MQQRMAMAAGAASLGDDVEQLAEAARSDRDAFARLYLDHRAPVYRYLRARCGPEDAADLTAETFERALRAVGRYRSGQAGFRAWLFRIARNAAIDHHRRASRTRPTEATRHEPSAESVFVAREDVAELSRALECLTGDQREAIALRYGAGLTAREIGLVLDRSEAAAQKLVSRGLTALKEVYGVR